MEPGVDLAAIDESSRGRKVTWKGVLRLFLIVALIGVLALFGVAVKKRWNDPNFVNFLVAWIPFVLSILLAFIPDSAMKILWRIIWRSGVILGGLLYSALLWHQQSLTAAAAKEDQRQLLSYAVNNANTHSDEKIGSLSRDVQGVKKDLENTIGATISQSTSSLSKTIGSVGKSQPPEKAKILFSLWPFNDDGSPNLVTSLSPDKDGIFTINMTFKNAAISSAADNMDVWIEICKICQFAGEPDGFDKPSGISEQVRHRVLNVLNPGIAVEKTPIKIKLTYEIPFFQIGFTYACAGCKAKDEKQIATVYVAKPQ